MLNRTVVAIVVFLVLTAQSAFAWNDTGHRLIALIAWEDLTPKSRTAIAKILRDHPRYRDDLLAGLRQDATPEESARSAFATAAVWPDIVRSRSHPMNVAYNKPQWHYVNIPFEDGFKAGPDERAAKESGPANIVEALTQSRTELKDRSLAPAKKAIALCWMNHLVGDLHQPLHAATRYTPEFRNGDTGGNSAIVLRSPPFPDSKVNLHSLWDTMPGQYDSEFIIRYLADGLRRDPKYARADMRRFLGKADFTEWAKESHAMAVEHVYLKGKLKVASTRGRNDDASGGGRSDNNGNNNNNNRGRSGDGDGGRSDSSSNRGDGDDSIPGVPRGYLKDAERVSMRQVVLAGYRLADVLNAAFDPGK